MLVNGKVEQGQGIGLVVIRWVVPQSFHSGDHLILVGVSFAGNKLFDGTHGNTLVGNFVPLTPGREVS